MELFATTSSAHRRAGSCVIVGVYENGEPGAGAADIDSASKGRISRLIKDGDISGKTGSSLLLTSLPGVRATRVLVVGLGKPADLGISAFRKAVAVAAEVIKNSKIREAVSYLGLEDVPGGRFPVAAPRTSR